MAHTLSQTFTWQMAVMFNTSIRTKYGEKHFLALFSLVLECSGIFFIDTSGQLSSVPGGIYWCDRSSIDPIICLSYGKSLEEFLENIFSGNDPRRNL